MKINFVLQLCICLKKLSISNPEYFSVTKLVCHLTLCLESSVVAPVTVLQSRLVSQHNEHNFSLPIHPSAHVRVEHSVEPVSVFAISDLGKLLEKVAGR